MPALVRASATEKTFLSVRAKQENLILDFITSGSRSRNACSPVAVLAASRPTSHDFHLIKICQHGAVIAGVLGVGTACPVLSCTVSVGDSVSLCWCFSTEAHSLFLCLQSELTV